MPYQTFPFAGFGRGLNLRDKPDAVDPAECIDALNVLFSDRGAIQGRPGFGELTEAELTNRVDSLSPFYTTGGLRQLLAGCGTRLEAISTGGAVIASAAGLSGGPYGFARFGKPNAEVAYAGNGTDTLRKWNGLAWSAPTAKVDGEAGKAMPKAGSLAAWPGGGNRLVATGFATATGGPAGSTSSPDHVYFSEPGDPESWLTTGLTQLLPGNGEKIMAVVNWRELLFVFKETVFFVFDRGVSSDAEGNPEFHFRPVEAGVGLVSPRAICVDESGVYFMSRHGVYRTTGQEPEEISGQMGPIWSGASSDFYTGGELAHASITNCAMATFEDRIYLSFPTQEANNRTLVFDPQGAWWSLTDLPCAALTSFRVGATEELVFGYAAGEKKIGRHSRSFTDDAGEAIVEYHRSGWFDLGNPDLKKVRSTKAWGSGKCFMALAPDFKQGVGELVLMDFSDPTSDTWGGTTWGGGEWAESKVLVERQRRRAVRGSVFSVYVENREKGQSFSLHRLEHLLSEVLDPAKGDSP